MENYWLSLHFVGDPDAYSHTINDLSFVEQLFKMKDDNSVVLSRHPELASPLKHRHEDVPTSMYRAFI